jgi:transposase
LVAGDWRDKRIAQQDKRIAELESMLAARDRIINEQQRRIATLVRRIEKLEEQLKQSSQNSSKPPSSDPPWEPRAPKKKRSGRKPGGQPGHKGHQRELLPPEQVDELHDVWPEECDNCQLDLSRGTCIEVGEPLRHQVAELPVVKPHVTEWRLHAQCCPHCSWTTAATLPDTVARSWFGPRLQATIGVLTGNYRLTKRKVQLLLNDMFGVTMALGSISACERRTSEALADAVDEARRYVESQAVGYADETGWKQGGERAWVWVVVTALVTVFLVHARRNAEAARQLLGRFAGVLVSDRWSAYSSWPLDKRQLCWAHLIRYWTAFSEQRGKARRIGERLLELSGQMFTWWHRVRDGTLARSTFQQYMRPVQKEVEQLLEKGTRCRHKKMAATCRAIFELATALWTFVRIEGVEPTNNLAEQALRDCVIRRKTSFGTQSEAGSRFIERMLTVSATLRQQKRNVLEFVTDACERAIEGRRPPSLLPGYRAVTRAPPHAA